MIRLGLVRAEAPAAADPSPALSPRSPASRQGRSKASLASASLPSAAFATPQQAVLGSQGLVSPGAAAAAPSDLSGVDADQFRQALLARIARYKQYPPDALRNHVQCTVWVRFLVDRDGRLLGVWVDQSSGQAVLDDEAVAAIRRAAPFPAIPSSLPDKIDLTLGIPFSLG
jgi:protein TonB